MILVLLLTVWPVSADETIRLYPGFVTKVHCEGRLLVSAVGNENLVRLEALPKELGCGALLKPTSANAQTNLILETTAGTVRRMLLISGASSTPRSGDLDCPVRGAIE